MEGGGKSAKEVFEEHHREIQRRSSVARSGDGVNPGTFERATDASDVPWRLEDQAYVLFSVSHARMPPIAPDPRNPAVRIYGAFADVDAALAHAKVVQSVDASVNLQMNKTHEWIVARSAPERIDKERDEAHAQRILAAHHEARRSSTHEFNENVREARGAQPTFPSAEATDDDDVSEVAAPPRAAVEGMAVAASLPRSAEVRGQTVAVASFLPDLENRDDAPEFIFRVYACFEGQADANRYVRNTASHEERDVDIDVVATCEWLHAQTVDASQLKSEIFRAPELSNIISQHKAAPQQVQSFRKWRDVSAED